MVFNRINHYFYMDSNKGVKLVRLLSYKALAHTTHSNGGSIPPTSTKYLAFIGLITNGGNEWLVGAR